VNADAFARDLELRLDDVPICLACLSFVAFAVDSGDEREVRRWTREMTPDLWDEGLALPVKLAVDRACRRGVRGAPDAAADLELHGSRSATARAIVRRLGEELSARARRDRQTMGFERLEPD
jgi:hypothetical protein